MGKPAHEVVFDALLEHRARSNDVVGTALLVVARLVEWGYPLRYEYDTDTHASSCTICGHSMSCSCGDVCIHAEESNDER